LAAAKGEDMSEWIDFAICAAFLSVFWFVAPRSGPAWTVAFLAERNAAWVGANPEVIRRLSESRWFARSCYALGALNLALLLALKLGPWADPTAGSHWQGLWGVTAASLLIGTLYNVVGAGLFKRWLRRVPLGERRSASLAPRSLADYLTLQRRLATYAFVVAVPTAWLVVGSLRLHTSADFWAELLNLSVLSAIYSALFSFMPYVSVKRPPNVMDRVIGPANRRTEVRSAFAVQLVPPIVGTISLIQELAGLAPLEIQRGCQLGLVVLLTRAFLQYTKFAPPRADGGAAVRAPAAKRPATSS
jgi:hypothetical protein